MYYPHPVALNFFYLFFLLYFTLEIKWKISYTWLLRNRTILKLCCHTLSHIHCLTHWLFYLTYWHEDSRTSLCCCCFSLDYQISYSDRGIRTVITMSSIQTWYRLNVVIKWNPFTHLLPIFRVTLLFYLLDFILWVVEAPFYHITSISILRNCMEQ